ncbi:hypothetical protein Fmac_016475 [Flemingia macrophylla]|uniref:Uncharacterized protein n=1 Tax=Flemingia macrophylla TaxID=520843 RepID=A0ABD1MHI9_9FABA
MWPTLCLDKISNYGNAIMLGVYEALKQKFAGGTYTSGLSRRSLIVAVGLAGASSG